ncbi:hypothetical protein WMY93_007043 [Mugilogobius chulae]|uniref:C2H2-type domain-containing protein n=1 Tax=Mugilogobius chulae TaxID=88201 RepID=A0AAW0Q1J8_9GOBI
MSKGLALLEQSLLQYDEEISRAKSPAEPRAGRHKTDVHGPSRSPERDRSLETVQKQEENMSVELPFNTVIVKNKCDAKETNERREHAEGEESEDEEGEDEGEEAGCSSDTKVLVFSSFESDDSDEWEPEDKSVSEKDGEETSVKERTQQGPTCVQPSAANQDKASVWRGSAPLLGSLVFHNCSLKENRSSRSNEPRVEQINKREKERPGCSAGGSEKTKTQQNTSNSSTSKQTDTSAPSLAKSNISEVQKTAVKDKRTSTAESEVAKASKHKCADCGKFFQCEAHLQRHMLIHYGLKPFECPVCDKAFRYKSSFKAHLNMHTEEKPLSCTICRKGFTQSRDLRRHMLSHTDEKNFDCQECGGKFKHKHNLIRHIAVIHKAEKRYPCPMCDKAFAQKHDFMTHMRTHSGEKPFSCHICTRSFGAKGTLRTHMKVHRKRVPKDLQETRAFDKLEESVSGL